VACSFSTAAVACSFSTAAVLAVSLLPLCLQFLYCRCACFSTAAVAALAIRIVSLIVGVDYSIRDSSLLLLPKVIINMAERCLVLPSLDYLSRVSIDRIIFLSLEAQCCSCRNNYFAPRLLESYSDYYLSD
jgi:hypothetical protein